MTQAIEFKLPMQSNIDIWRNTYFPNITHELTREWLGKAAEEFNTFKSEYRDYFREFVYPGVTNVPVKWLDERVERTLDAYWAPFERVVEQWQVVGYRDILNNGTEEAIKYLRKMNLDPEVTGVLLYFDKIPLIRRCPFSNIAVLGVPHRLVSNVEPDKRDWMAIPHELGHYLFWNRKNFRQFRREQTRIRKKAQSRIEQSSKLAQLPIYERENITHMILDWLEEIYADLVGTWLGGNEFVDSLQTIIERAVGDKKHLKENDGHHPPYCVRPFIRLKMMEFLEKPVKKDKAFWGKFLLDNYNVKKPGALTIQANMDLLDTIQNNSDDIEEVKAILANEPTESFTLAKVEDALEPLLRFLSEEIDTSLVEMGNDYQATETGFSALEVFAVAEAQAKRKQVYEILLQPRILEGGDQHTHGCWRHRKWHNAFTHFH